MDRYQLAKIIDWAGTLNSRKRMQKVVYLLQQAGCPLEADFILHHYGPYSQDVARLTDEMVRLGLLGETTEATSVGEQYAYHLPEETRRKIEEAERSNRRDDSMSSFEDRAKFLIKADLKELEIAATLVYFQRQYGDWSSAAEKTRKFKNLPPDSRLLVRAEALAKHVVS